MRNVFLTSILTLAFVSMSAKAEKDWLYSVRPGDNLWNLCAQYTTRADCWLKLGNYNSVIYPRQLPPGLIIRFPISWLKDVPKTTTLSYYSGEVWSYTDDPNDLSIIELGEKLALGTTVITGENSYATLRFDDGTLLQIEPNSKLLIESQSGYSPTDSYRSEIFLNSGAVKTRVPERQPKSRFQIRTPSAIAAVRGTEYRLVSRSADSDQEDKNISITEVTEGVVAVSANTSEVDVKKGFSVKTEQGKAPSAPKPLLVAPSWHELVKTVQTVPVSLAWVDVADATAYKLDVLKDNDQGEVIESIELAGVQYTDAALAYSEGCFRFQLKAIDQEGIQGLPQNIRVCLTEKVDAPVVARAKSVAKPENDIVLQWQGSEQAQSYIVEISRTADFIEVTESYVVTEPNLMLTWHSDYDQGFYYRIKAVSGDGINSEFSQTGQLVIDRLPGKALTAWSVFWVLILAL